MTWEETIIQIRRKPEFADLVRDAYFDEDLTLNIERFKGSLEYSETHKIISSYFDSLKNLRILDIGSGNGISAISFSRDGARVTVVEPDKSVTVGSGAVRKMAEHYHLSDFAVHDTYGEKLPFMDGSFDMVYIRQAMHHAADLNTFVKEAARVLRPGGLFLTIRDHVIYDEKDKQWFLEMHPLHKFYGGENAFTYDQYVTAMEAAGLRIEKIFRYFDNPINYFPVGESEMEQMKQNREKLVNDSLQRRLPSFLAKSSSVKNIYSRYVNFKLGPVLNEKLVPGRMYSFVAIKPL